MFKFHFEKEVYLSLNLSRRLLKCIAKFRTVSLDLEVEIGRRYGIPKEDRLCKLCGKSNIIKIEDEYHVLMECMSYSDLPAVYIGDINVNLFSFCSILCSNDELHIVRLANFISAVLDVRKRLLENL